MKKLFLLFFLAFASVLSTQAQDKKFTIGLGGGVSMMSQKATLGGEEAKANGTGFTFLGNFYYNINPKISVGLEIASAAAILEGDSGSDVDATAIGNYSLRGKYHFGESKVRPHVGLGIGMYNVVPGSAGFDSKTAFGVSPEVGLNLGFFQISGIYHIMSNVNYDILGEEELKLGSSNFELRAIFNINFASR